MITTEATTEQLDELIRRIVETVNPLRIILFGSAARGESPQHDLDILVIMPEGTHRRHTAQDIYEHLFGIDIPVDVLVATPTDLKQHKDDSSLVYAAILREGREIYAA